jgi:two-component system alkaline phosphatase synthesis response regulator PhoP
MSGKILIVDDEETIRGLLRLTLEDDGFEIFEAENGTEAVQKAKEIKPDLILLDVMMPGMSGYEVCEIIKSDPELNRAVVIFLSSRTNPAAEMTGKMKGADHYLTKPFKTGDLREKVKQALSEQ